LIYILHTALCLTIFKNNHQTFIYSNKPLSVSDLNCEEGILLESLNDQGLFIKDNYPFLGIPPEIKFYASSPLISSTGNKIGILAVLDLKERKLSSNHILSLTSFSKIISDTIENHLKNQKVQQVFSDFLHKGVHDLKNPLTSISLAAEILARKANDAATVVQLAQQLGKANKRLVFKLNALKAISPINHENFKLDTKEINLNNFLKAIKDNYPQLEIIILAGSETNIYADEKRLLEAINKIINYFLPTTNSTEPKLFIKSYEENSLAVIELADTLNEKGFITNENQINSTTLTIAKMLIEMQQGKIRITNHQELNNYRLYISLPLSTS
ncbi:histidine kinase, partial [Pedobacter sp.]